MNNQGGSLAARLAPLAIAAAMMSLTAACADDDGVASLTSVDPNASQETQLERANAMAECLRAAGIEAEARPDNDGQQADLDFGEKQSWSISLGDGGFSTSWGQDYKRDQSATEDAMNAMVSEYDRSETVPAFLIIGDQDHTKVFRECLASTGYTPPVWGVMTPAEELEEKQERLEATTNWIICARDNGYPDLKDPPAPKADNWDTQPMALLPRATTEAELMALLAACPNFNEEQSKAGLDELKAAGYDDLPSKEANELWDKTAAKYPGMISPSIGFDRAGFDGDLTWSQAEDLSDASEERLRQDREETERLQELTEIIGKAEDDFLAAYYGW
ncbi:MAG: hypothetical protein LBJ62_05675 [Bifidobacteriaceae bacterium]|nr:hypothetical protein [Bifidobacteriaceae bacterium]